MKRKLSALLSLVLAVVMVFPTAVFVSADDPAPTPTKITISNTVKFEKGTGETWTLDESNIQIPVGGTLKITLAPSVEGCNLDIDSGMNNSAVEIAYTSGTSFVLTGNMADKTTTLKIKATHTDTAKYTASDVKTITVKCVKADTVYQEKTNKDTNAYKITYSGSTKDHEFEASEKASCSSIELLLNNAKKVTTSNVKVTATATETRPTDTSIYENEITLTAEHKYIHFMYTVDDATYGKFTGFITQRIYVKNEEIKSISITKAHNNPFKLTDTIAGASDIVVTVTFKNSTSVRTDYNLYAIKAESKTAAIAYAQNAAERDARLATTFKDRNDSQDIYMVVEFQGKYEAQAVFGDNSTDADDLFNFDNPVPTAIDVEVDGTQNKEYYYGQTFGDSRVGFGGVTIKVTYDTGDTDTFVNNSGNNTNKNGIVNVLKNRGELTITPFEVGSNEITFSYKENDTLKTVKKTYKELGITVSEDEVIGLELVNPKSSYTFTEGASLDLGDLKLKLIYKSGRNTTETINYNSTRYIEMIPADGTTLGTTINTVTFRYKLADDMSVAAYVDLPITVNAKAPEGKKITNVQLAYSSSNGLTEYFIGEEFDPDDFKIQIIFNDGSTVTQNLSSYKSKYVIDSTYYNNSSEQFTKVLEGPLAISFEASASGSTYNAEITIPKVVVTKRPILQSFTVYSTKTEYWVGDAPRVCDFTIIAKYDEGSDRTYSIDYVENDKNTYGTSYDSRNDTGYVGIRRQISLSPTRIDSDTKKITVTYTETVEGVNYKKTAEFELDKVNIPDAIVTYRDPDNGGATATKSFEDVYNAILFAIEMRQDTESKYYSYPPEVELQRDATLDYSVNTRYSFDIDLNGYSLTMIRGNLDIASSGTADTEIIITNNDRNDGKLVFSNDEEDTVIIAYRDTFTIDADSNNEGKYDVTITTPKNGKVTGPDEVTHGRDAQFTITPDEGYEIASIKVNNKSKAADNDGKLVISDVQEKLTVTVTFKEKAWDCPFTDVYKSASYYRAIQFVYENELFQGTSATKFEPDTTMTRAMFVTVLGRLAKVNVNNYSTMSFTDVKNSAATSWYVPYVEWAASIGLVEGYGNGKFGPDDPITHAQMYVLMQRYALLVEKLATNATGTSIPANDVKDIPEWAVDAVRYAAKKDFLVLSSNRLTPNANAKRSELAVLLNDFCENVLGWDD